MDKFSTFEEMILAASGQKNKSGYRAINERAIERVAQLFSWLFPSLAKRKCLFKSLLIMKWSEGYGMYPLLNIGMKFSGRVQGHAWLTVDNLPFCDSSRLCEQYPHPLAGQGRIRYWCEA